LVPALASFFENNYRCLKNPCQQFLINQLKKFPPEAFSLRIFDDHKRQIIPPYFEF